MRKGTTTWDCFLPGEMCSQNMHQGLLPLIPQAGEKITISFVPRSSDLKGKVFVFMENSNTTQVVLKNVSHEPLTSFTVCLKFYTDVMHQCGLFSYSTENSDHEFLLFRATPSTYYVYVGGQNVSFRMSRKPYPSWEHVCVSWESATGLVGFWANGFPLPRKGLKKGYSLSPKACITLGKEQDNLRGRFPSHESFVGEMQDVYMWSRVLTSDELSLVWEDGALSNYLIDWRVLSYDLKGYVVLEPSLFSE